MKTLKGKIEEITRGDTDAEMVLLAISSAVLTMSKNSEIFKDVVTLVIDELERLDVYGSDIFVFFSDIVEEDSILFVEALSLSPMYAEVEEAIRIRLLAKNNNKEVPAGIPKLTFKYLRNKREEVIKKFTKENPVEAKKLRDSMRSYSTIQSIASAGCKGRMN